MKVSRSLLIWTALLSVSQVLCPLTSLGQTRTVRARVTRPLDLHDLVTLHGNVHPLARPEFDQGVAPDDLPMERILMVLQRGPEQEAALRQLLDDQQVKSSPRFHQWLTPEQFGQQFGPADSDLQAVTDWLTTRGFQVTNISVGRTVLEFSGTAGLVRQVLGTEIRGFRVNGEEHWANTSNPQIPAALAPVVAGFASLNNFPRKPLYQSLGTFSRSKATGEVQPLFTYLYGGYYLAVGPTDFATIYNVAPLWSAGTDGAGVTIAVVGETNINIQDVRDFRKMFGLPANDPNIILNGPDPGIIGEETEADLDVQWSGAIAKGATIDLVVSESTETTSGIDLSALYIIDNNLAPIMSESYGTCEAELGAGGNQFYNTLWEQAAAQGITVLTAAGDSGSAGCDSANAGETAAQYGLGVSGLASTPFNVAVGGTDFNDASNPFTYWSKTNTSPSQSSALSYIPESTWNDSCADSGLTGCTVPKSGGYDLVAGSGGPSSCTNPSGTFPNVTCSGGYAKPSWQSAAGVPKDSARDIPDVSLFAGGGLNNSFYVICQMDANARSGGNSTSCNLNSPFTNFQSGAGTSASVQTFAGIMALVNQRYGRQGNANYVLYPMAAQSGASCNSSTAPLTNSSCIFYDVTVGNNSVICKGGTPNCSSSTSGQYGIMVSGGSAAYATTTGNDLTTGYDLATGLGSVNVANLVNNWISNFTTTTTALSSLSPTTLTHGQPINFTINVASGKGTPAGDVSLIAQTGSSSSNPTGIGPFPLNGGSVSSSTNMLPGGTYNVTAHYAGNGTYAASDSSPGIQVTVGKEGSQTKISLVTFDLITNAPSYGATTAAYGSPYVLRMDVMHASDGNSCASATTGLITYPCPTGALIVSPAPTEENPPSGTVPGSYILNSQGYAEDEPIQQHPGLYNFVASYAGDNSYAASTSPPLPIKIGQAPTTITSCSLPSTMVVGTTPLNCLLTVTTQSNGAAPTGTVQLLTNGAPVGNWLYVIGSAYSNSTGSYASAQVTDYYTLAQAGIWSVTFQYSGDTNYAGSTTSPVTINVTNFTMSANPTSLTLSPGQAGTSTISITPQYGFTGTVALNVGPYCPTGAICTLSPPSVTVSGTSTATSTLTITPTAGNSAPPGLQRKSPPTSFRLPVRFLWLLAGSLALAMLLGSSAIRQRPAALLFATALVVVAVWAACGGGSGSGGGGGGGGGTPTPTPTPAVTISYPSLNLGSQNVGTSSATQNDTLINTGTAALSISNIGLTGTNPGDFSQTNNCNTSVAAGASCTISVKFTPTATGVRSASVSIADNASGSPQTISLSGTGTSVPTPPGNYSVDVFAVGEGYQDYVMLNVTVQ